MLKKPSILLSSYGNLYTIYCPQQMGSSPVYPPTRRPHSGFRSVGSRKPQWRDYAQVHSDKPRSHNQDEFPWPELASATAIPSPYQIFHLKKTAPYSKRHFYELVKLYHPDRHGHQHNSAKVNGLPHTVKMERYRLVVAANDILSDPEKRKAYDCYGAGWNGQSDSDFSKHNWSHNTGTRWSGFDYDSSPSHCATWEDWERWYQRDRSGKAKQAPVYFSNGGFVSLIIIVIALSGFGQATRVGDYSRTFWKRIEAVHGDCSYSIQTRRKESYNFGNKDERLQSFLRTREESGIPVGYGVPDPRQETHRRLSPPPDV